MLTNIQSLFADILQTPEQRAMQLRNEGLNRAELATRGLSGGAAMLSPLIAAEARTAPMREEMLSRSLGRLFGQDVRTESESIQNTLSQADTSTPEGQQALITALRNQGYGAQAAQLQQQMAEQAKEAEAAKIAQDLQERQVAVSEGNLGVNRAQQAAALAATQAEQTRLRQQREANKDSSLDLINGATGLKPADAATLRSMVTRNPDITLAQVQAAITNFGGFPDEGSSPAANLQVRTGRLQGESGLQTFTFNPSTNEISRTIQNPDGTFREERLPSNKVAFVTATADSAASVFDPDSRATTTPSQKPLFELVGSATGIGSTLTGLYNETPLADLFGTDEAVAEAQARFAGFENKIMELYSTRSRPSNWSEQRILRLLPKVGTILESTGSAEAKLVVLNRAVQDQYDYEIQQYQANTGNPTRQQEHFDNIQDLGRLLDDFGPMPVDKETLPVPTTRAEIESLPEGAQFWLEGKVATWANGQIVTGQ